MSRRSDCGFSHPLSHGDWRMIPRSVVKYSSRARSDGGRTDGGLARYRSRHRNFKFGKGRKKEGRERDRMQRRQTAAAALSHMGFSRINRHKNFRFLFYGSDPKIGLAFGEQQVFSRCCLLFLSPFSLTSCCAVLGPLCLSSSFPLLRPAAAPCHSANGLLSLSFTDERSRKGNKNGF